MKINFHVSSTQLQLFKISSCICSCYQLASIVYSFKSYFLMLTYKYIISKNNVPMLNNMKKEKKNTNKKKMSN